MIAGMPPQFTPAANANTGFGFNVGVPAEFQGMDMSVTLHGDGETAPIEAMPGEEEDGFLDNLALTLDPNWLRTTASELKGEVARDIESRQPFDGLLERGMKQLGFDRNQDKRSDPFPGACAMYHPVMANALVDYAARAMKELFPPSGPAKTQIIGQQTRFKMDQADRVEQYMNWQLTQQMPEYRRETRRSLMLQGLSGDVFKKIYWDPYLRRPVSECVAAADLVVPYSARSLQTSPRVTHVIRLHKHEAKRNMVSGLWREMDLTASGDDDGTDTRVKEKNDKIVGRVHNGTADDNTYLFHEVCCTLDVPGDERDDGLSREYVVTLHPRSGEILALRRNWREDDPLELRRQWYVQYGLIPWDGFYHLGFLHLIGGLAEGVTGAMRMLFDAGMLSSMPPIGKIRGPRISNSMIQFGPLKVAEFDAPGVTDIARVMQPIKVAEPNPVLFQTMQYLAQEAKDFATVAMVSPDQLSNVPATSILAHIEQGSTTFAQIHADNHAAQAKELAIIGEMNAEHMDNQVTAQTFRGEVIAYREDFTAEHVSIVPVSDPNIFSQMQRAQRSAATLELVEKAKAAGIKVNDQIAFEDAARAIGIPNVDELFPQQQQMQPPPPMDPVTEFMAILAGKPVQAAPGQDHIAHVKYLMARSQDPQYGPMMQKAGPALESLVANHLALQSREEIEQQLGMPLPPPGQPLPPQIAARIAAASAQVAQQQMQQRVMVAQQQAQAQQGARSGAPGANPQLEAVKHQNEMDLETQRAADQRSNDERQALLASQRQAIDAETQRQEDARATANDLRDAAGDAADRQIELTKIASEERQKQIDAAARIHATNTQAATSANNARIAAEAAIITTAMKLTGQQDVQGPLGSGQEPGTFEGGSASDTPQDNPS